MSKQPAAATLLYVEDEVLIATCRDSFAGRRLPRGGCHLRARSWKFWRRTSRPFAGLSRILTLVAARMGGKSGSARGN